MNSNFLVVVADFILFSEWLAIGLYYSVDLSQWRLRLLSAGFLVAAGGMLLLTVGDIAIWLGLNTRDIWFLQRGIRPHSFRLPAIVGFGIYLFALRFNGRKG